jgi:hypothetical protein
MRYLHALLAASVLLVCVGAAPDDFAVIDNSGSTNVNGYVIQIWADGDGSVMLQTRDGRIAGSPKPFRIPVTIARKFFTDLAAARNGNATTVPCMKTVSFGASLKVAWQGWESTDLTCPPKDELANALARDAEAIAQSAGVSALPNVLNPGSRPSIPPP